MSAGRVHVTLDTARFIEACRRATAATNELRARFRVVARAAFRVGLSPGERHIDRVCQEILQGKPGRDATVRLIAAADFAAVLDAREVAR